MSLMIVKKMDKKSVVWFESSNQYLMLDPFVASAVERIYNQENNEDLALELMNKHQVPREKAMDFISDLKEKLVFPNTAPKEWCSQTSRNTKSQTNLRLLHIIKSIPKCLR